MKLLDPNTIKIDQTKMALIHSQMTAVYRRIVFSRLYSDDDLLEHYTRSLGNLQSLLSIKNAQMEAQTEEEASVYLRNLQFSLDFIIEQILQEKCFSSIRDLFALLRIVSPEAHARHPNKFRSTFVQVGSFLCPPPEEIESLVSELFFHLEQIANPVVRAIYLHHELIRIHPFVDGNGRVSRMAKNWIFLFDLLPPIFIDSPEEKKDYVSALSESFHDLASDNGRESRAATERFFDQEMNRLLRHTEIVHRSVFEATRGDEL